MVRKFDPDTIYRPFGRYYNAVEVEPGEALVISAGIVGARADGSMPCEPAEQIALAWQNVAAWLRGCGLTRDDLVKLTMYLTDHEHVVVSKAARIAALGEPQDCAVTGLIVGLFEPEIYIEIDAYAVKPRA